ncbi:MAG: polyphosphate kinase 2 family protein [Eubacteriaceae bacterium]|nr:polyphosphate kinase 2 family protein [Eubacteriaceae bacterium]
MLSLSKYRIEDGKNFRLADHNPSDTAHLKNKKEIAGIVEENIRIMAEEQDKLYAQNDYALLIIVQATDAAGKDSLIKHVMTGLNPRGTSVYSFKQPTTEEMDHDFLWRTHKSLPERGCIGIFNRSYYEDVLIVRVHNLLNRHQIPHNLIDENFWDNRLKQICHYERYLIQNGILPVKFFLHLSKEEQKERFLKRINDPTKNWKFSFGDIEERRFWDDYQKAYELAIQHTSTPQSPWYIIPADKKWFARLLVSDIIAQKLQSLHLEYPTVSDEQKQQMEKAKKILLDETK